MIKNLKQVVKHVLSNYKVIISLMMDINVIIA